MDFQAIVVGAGPVGCIIAEIIAREGYDVLILEEHDKVGVPQHCTGKISVNAAKELDLPLTSAVQKVRGANFYSPDLTYLTVKRSEPQAYIFNRELLDKQLSKNAIDSGAILLTGAQMTDITVNADRVKIAFSYGNRTNVFTSRVVIGADGANSLVARSIGLSVRKKNNVRLAVQREITGLYGVEQEFVDIYLGREFSPGFFAWIVPTSNGKVKVGLCVEPNQGHNLLNYIEKFTKTHPIAMKKLENGICTNQTVHVIPTGGSLPQTVSDGALVVGDAAGQVKSTTGGGIYYGIICARIAGKVVSEALAPTGGTLRKDSLSMYDSLWRRRLGREIDASVRIRMFLDSLTDEEVNYLFHLAIEKKDLIRLVESEGDIDWQSKIFVPALKQAINALVKRPSLLFKFRKFLSF